MSGRAAFLLDVEGTTTPVTFVTEVLFPFARARLRPFLEARLADPDVARELQALEVLHARESASVPPADWTSDRLASACAYLEWLMDRDRKATPLKTLQGRIWEDGFASGALVAPVYDDVPVAFERWHAAGCEVAIFSSGSVLAQRLLFAHSSAGDLGRFLSAYFDTTTGAKREAASYERIAALRGLAPGRVLFVSDVAAELDAALAAGMRTALCVRPGSSGPQYAGPHPVVRSFDALDAIGVHTP